MEQSLSSKMNTRLVKKFPTLAEGHVCYSTHSSSSLEPIQSSPRPTFLFLLDSFQYYSPIYTYNGARGSVVG
jgi:hypothetical protein